MMLLSIDYVDIDHHATNFSFEIDFCLKYCTKAKVFIAKTGQICQAIQI